MVQAAINEGATLLNQNAIWNNDTVSSFSGYLHIPLVVAATTGSHTYKVQAKYGTGSTGTASVNNPSTGLLGSVGSFITAEDIGT